MFEGAEVSKLQRLNSFHNEARCHANFDGYRTDKRARSLDLGQSRTLIRAPAASETYAIQSKTVRLRWAAPMRFKGGIILFDCVPSP